MGLDDADLIDDGDGGGRGGKASAAAVACSICFDLVTDDGDRSWAKLQCGHQFHLDCIGSAFNVKGVMQCPNCRTIEKGRWLYADGGRQLPEFSMDDWRHDEDPYYPYDPYDLSYSEMSFGVHWCPFCRLPSSFDEGEYPSSVYHHHTIFTEHPPLPSTTHHCPYIAYFGPIHPSSSTSSGDISDGSNFSNHWSGLLSPSEVPNSYGLPSMDAHYHNWDHSSHFRIGSADQPPIPSRTPRNSDIPRPILHPFIVGHSSGSRASSVIPPYPGPIARPPRSRPPLQAYFQQSSSAAVTRASLISGGRRNSNSHRGLAQVGPLPSSSDHPSGFYVFPSSSSGTAENPPSDHFHHPSLADRDSIWSPFHPSGGGSDSGVRPSSFSRQRHGPSQNRT